MSTLVVNADLGKHRYPANAIVAVRIFTSDALL